MTMPAAMISSDSEVWSTPPDFYAALNREFGFELDVCALPGNAKCSRYFTPEDDGLAQPWAPSVCWMNPPYGRTIAAWMAKAHDEAHRGATVVCLVPARTDARWWHDHALQAHEIRFLKGRLKYVPDAPGRPTHSTPFPSAVVVFRPGERPECVTVWLRKCDACGLPVVRRPNARTCSPRCRQRAHRRRRGARS